MELPPIDWINILKGLLYMLAPTIIEIIEQIMVKMKQTLPAPVKLVLWPVISAFGGAIISLLAGLDPATGFGTGLAVSGAITSRRLISGK